MRLCDTDIERHLDEGKIVIEPRPGVERISGVSVDVLLGNEFRVFRDHTAPYIDLSGPYGNELSDCGAMKPINGSTIIPTKLTSCLLIIVPTSNFFMVRLYQ